MNNEMSDVRIHAHWVDYPLGHKCSWCDSKALAHYSYCPSCGAIMDEKTDDSYVNIIDAVSIVRCKDCAFSEIASRNSDMRWCAYFVSTMPCNGFCSEGRLRGRNGNDKKRQVD